MRIIVAVLIVALGGCSGENDQQSEAALPAAASTDSALSPMGKSPVESAVLLAIPSETKALKRLEAMGYTVHQEEGHLHAPGVKGCPAMADSPVM